MLQIDRHIIYRDVVNKVVMHKEAKNNKDIWYMEKLIWKG